MKTVPWDTWCCNSEISFPLPKREGWEDPFAKKSSSSASANPLLLTDLFLLRQSLLCWHMRFLMGIFPEPLYPFSGAERVSEAVGGCWGALTSLLLDSLARGVRIRPHYLDALGREMASGTAALRGSKTISQPPHGSSSLKSSFQRWSSANISFPALTSHFVTPSPSEQKVFLFPSPLCLEEVL